MPRRVLAKPKLPKQLLQPIELPPIVLPTILNEGSFDAAEARLNQIFEEQNQYVARQRAEKLGALLEYYGVNIDAKDGWKNLAVALACDFIDGFKTTEKYSKKKKWDGAVLYRLWFEVESSSKRISAWNACSRLVKKEPWSTLLQRKNESPMSASTRVKALYEWYLKAQKSALVRFVQNIQKQHPTMKCDKQLYDVLNQIFPIK